MSKKNSQKKCVVIFGGGADSAVVVALLVKEGYEVTTLTFDYGQKNIGELMFAQFTSVNLCAIAHHEIKIQGVSKMSTLMDKTTEVPKDRTIKTIESGIASTYVPARNTIFLAYALGYAEQIGATYIAAGAVGDESVTTMMPDCEPEYFKAFERMANLATKATMEEGQCIKILTPLTGFYKDDVYKKGVELGVDFSQTLSCYDPVNLILACGRCDACIIRKDGFKKAGIKDPTCYYTATHLSSKLDAFR